jgi:hypothetical protein
MIVHQLHLRAYVCKKCNGPVVATTLAIRKTVISGEIMTGQLVPSCLLCGDRPISVDEPGFGFFPIEWPMLSVLPANQRTSVPDNALLRAKEQEVSSAPLAAPLATAVYIKPVQ